MRHVPGDKAPAAMTINSERLQRVVRRRCRRDRSHLLLPSSCVDSVRRGARRFAAHAATQVPSLEHRADSEVDQDGR